MSAAADGPTLATAVVRLWDATAAHLVECTLVFAGVLVLTTLLRRAPARLRCSLWTVVAVKLLVPTALVTSMLPSARVSSAVPRSEAFWPIAMDLTASVGTAVTAVTPRPADASPLLLLALAGSWGLGTLGLATRHLWTWRRAARLVRGALVMHEGREVETVREVARSIGLRSAPALALSASAAEPAVSGVLRPIIVLPHPLAASLSDAELAAVLRHEVTHVRRRDNWAAHLHRLAVCLYWYFPLAWLVERRMLVERERACDEAVWSVKSLRAPYLTGLMKSCRLHWMGAAAGVSLAGGSSFMRRIELMRTGRIETRRRGWHSWCLGLVAVLVAALSVAAQTRTKAETSPPAEPPVTSESTTDSTEARTKVVTSMAPPVPRGFEEDDGTYAEPLPVGGKVKGPVVVQHVDPKYPPAALQARVQGSVTLRIVIDRQGKVSEVEVAKSSKSRHPLLVDAAIAAVHQWRFRPASLGGKPVSVRTTVGTTFKIY